MKKVQVLLSTYNGEKYLQEQLDSILNQSYSNISILIRDDGSSDGTLEILEKYSKNYPQIKYYYEKNVGVKNSFFDLIKKADLEFDYFAFSDQDDIWKNEKISSAVSVLNEQLEKIPLLYCGRTTLVDYKMQLIHTTIKNYEVNPDFRNAIVENICTGCTAVINRELLLLVRNHIPNFTVMHDWWLYLSASAFGKVIFDSKSYILYRQHENNAIGSRANYYDEFMIRLKNYKKNRGQISLQIEEFSKLYEIDKEKQQLIKYVLLSKHNFRYRFRILFRNEIYRQRIIDNIIFKVLFMMGKI